MCVVNQVHDFIASDGGKYEGVRGVVVGQA